MKNELSALAGFFLVGSLLTAACGGAPKQAEVADPNKESAGPDMAGEEEAAKPAEEGAKPAGEADMREKCCASCSEAVKTDRSGATPDKIPCADFTAALSPWCLEYFRAHPTMAAECK
jgi:hypothetical protein